MLKRVVLALTFVAALSVAGLGISRSASAGHGCGGYGFGYNSYYPGYYNYGSRVSYHRGYDPFHHHRHGHHGRHGRHGHHGHGSGVYFSIGF